MILRLRATEQRAGLDQAEAALQESVARRAEARPRLQRVGDIYARGVVPRATFDEATANSRAAEAQVAAAHAAVDRARAGVAYTQVTAPFGGIVTQRHARAVGVRVLNNGHVAGNARRRNTAVRGRGAFARNTAAFRPRPGLAPA